MGVIEGLARTFIGRPLGRVKYNLTGRKLLDSPYLGRAVHGAFDAAWRLVNGGYGIYEADLGGVKFRFYDPGGITNYRGNFFESKYLNVPIYEHSIVMHLKHITRDYDSPTLVDIGAHFGYYTVYMSKLGGPSSKVYSFEPNHEYFRVLRSNVRLNELQNVFLYNVALSDSSGYVAEPRTYYTYKLEHSKSFLSKGILAKRSRVHLKNTDSRPQNRVEATSFDKLTQTVGISSDIAKVDVAGAEGNVIAGMRKALKRNVSHLYCELHSDMTYGYSALDIVGMLQDAGMETYEFRGFRNRDGRLTGIVDEFFSTPRAWDGRMIYARK